jgi:hypothetical protein
MSWGRELQSATRSKSLPTQTSNRNLQHTPRLLCHPLRQQQQKKKKTQQQ